MRNANAMSAVLAVIAASGLTAEIVPSRRSTDSGRTREIAAHNAYVAARNAARNRQIADIYRHNQEVEQRKADKREAKRLRKLTGSPL